MIKKLQRKFIFITMASLLSVMLLLIGGINGINLYQMEQRLDGTLMLLSENEGKFPKFEKGNPPIEQRHYGFEINEETQFETRYFIVKTDGDGNVREINTSHIAAVSSEEAQDYGLKVLTDGKTEGYESIYKYRVVTGDNGNMLIFLDCRSQLQTARVFFFISLAVAGVTLLLVVILVSVFSKRAIKPFIESMEKQKQFITDAGHEIKTPIAIISANADVLELTQGNNEWITSIRNQTDRLNKLIKNLLMLAKTDEDDIKLVFSECNMSGLVLETIEAFTSMAKMQNKDLTANVIPGLKISGDKNSLRQMLSSLMDNALKYSDERGTIRVTLLQGKKGIKLEVFNTSEKIDTKNLDRLFDRFYRADFSRARETGGYGIGLSIVKSIVELHHGKITVGSDDGKSIRFTIYLG